MKGARFRNRDLHGEAPLASVAFAAAIPESQLL